MDIRAAVAMYDPDSSHWTRVSDPTWTAFDGIAVGEWDGAKPKPSQQDLLDADISSLVSVKHWFLRGRDCGYDYLQVRNMMLGALIAGGGFDNLTAFERQACVRVFLATAPQRLAVFPSQREQVEIFQEYHSRSIECRTSRFQKMEGFLSSRVLNLGYLVMLESMGEDLVTAYKRYGSLGIGYGSPVVGVLNYVFSTPGTKFEGSGLAEESLDLLGIDMPGLVQAIAAILTGAV